MMRKIFTRKSAIGIGAVALGLSALSFTVAGTAGADTLPSATEMTGSGSATAYSMMVQIGDLFNSSPGCDLAGSGNDAPNLNCGTDPETPNSSTAGENGYQQSDENPYDDYTVQAPAVGSTAGVAELNASSSVFDANGASTGQPAYARTSAGVTGYGALSDATAAQNLVAYATDGVDWSAFSADGKTAEPASYVTTLTQTQVEDIWAGTLAGCTLGSGKKAVTLGTMEWGCLFPPTTKLKAAEETAAKTPIDCYIAQPNSGTAGVWAGYANYNKKEDTPTGCLADEAGDKVDTLGSQAAVNDHINLFENEMSQVANSTVADQASAIYFFSYGKFTDLCKPTVGKTQITGDCPDTGSYVTAIGELTPSGGSGELPSQTDIQGTGPGSSEITWPVPRDLYNVYNNSTSSEPADQATLNFASEYGFICKPGTNTPSTGTGTTYVGNGIDPLTGVLYRQEIENIIYGQGFFPLDDAPADTFSEGTLSKPADITDANYRTVDPNYSASDPTGYCLSYNG
jgi:hypothetical protein